MPTEKTRTNHDARSIYIPVADIGIDKELNELAKNDKNIPIVIRNRKNGLISVVTILLWKKYINDMKRGLETI